MGGTSDQNFKTSTIILNPDEILKIKTIEDQILPSPLALENCKDKIHIYRSLY